MPDEKPKTHERIIDAAEEAPRGVALLRASLVLLLWALLAGVVVGAGCLATLKAVDLLQEVVWEGIAEALPQPLGAVAPVLFCTLGGVLVGVATSHTGFSLDTLGVVVGHCRTEGDCQVKSWPWALVLFGRLGLHRGARHHGHARDASLGRGGGAQHYAPACGRLEGALPRRE